MSSNSVGSFVDSFGIFRLACRMLFILPFCVLGGSTLVAAPPITDLAFSLNGTSVVACSQSGVSVYGWPKLARTAVWRSASANLNSVVFSPNGGQIAVGGGDPAEQGRLEVFTWPDGRRERSLLGHTDSIRATVWVDNMTVISACIDRSIGIWKLEREGRQRQTLKRQTLKGHSRSVETLCILRDGRTLVSAGVDQSLRVWDLNTGDLIRSLNQHTKRVNALSLRPANDGLPMVASASEDRTIRLWQPTIGRMVRYVRLDAEPLDIAWLPGGDRIAAACTDGRVRIVDAGQVKVIETHAAFDGWAYAVAAHPSDGSIVVGGSGGQLRRFSITSEAAP